MGPKKEQPATSLGSYGQVKRDIIKEVGAIINESNAIAVIVQRCLHKGPQNRRVRNKWDPQEVKWLRNGVAKHGEGCWTKILNDSAFKFKADRTVVDLKDKWRNLAKYSRYSERPLRKYMLLKADHTPLLTASGNPHIFVNRYPRDAALKVATKNEFYAEGQSTITIFIRELVESDVSPIVHVYLGSRAKDIAVEIPKFSGRRTVWVGYVEKLREEQLYTKETIKTLL